MNFKVIADTAKGIVSGLKIDKIIDEVVTSEEERGALKSKMADSMNQLEEKIQEQVTARHQADMASDSWLSKNIRPMTLIFILGLYTAFSMADGNIGSFNISDPYVKLLGEWGMLIMSFYFGGRTAEKLGSIAGAMSFRKDKRKRGDD